MSDIEMDCENGGNVDSDECDSVISSISADSSATLVPNSDHGNEASSPIDARCGNCSVPYDSKPPIAGECGHIQCSSCWLGGDACYKCNKMSNDCHEVFPTTARDLLSPEPPQSSGGNGPFNGENKELTSAAPTVQVPAQVAQVATPATSSAPLVQVTSQVGAQVGTKSLATASAPPVQVSSQARAQVGTKSPASSSARTLRVAAPSAQAGTRSSASTASARITEAPSNMANINVKCMNGTKVTARVNPSNTTVHEMKRVIHQQSGISTERMHLMHQAKPMTDSRNLKSYNVTDGSTLQMATKCYGG